MKKEKDSNNIFTNYYKFVSNMEANYYRNKSIRDRKYNQLKENRRKIDLYSNIAINISILIGTILLYIIFSIFANTFNILLWNNLFKILYATTIIGLISLTVITISIIEDYINEK